MQAEVWRLPTQNDAYSNGLVGNDGTRSIYISCFRSDDVQNQQPITTAISCKMYMYVV